MPLEKAAVSWIAPYLRRKTQAWSNLQGLREKISVSSHAQTRATLDREKGRTDKGAAS
jgi:hypothetical protein